MTHSIRYIGMAVLTFALSGAAHLALAETVVIVAAGSPVAALTVDQTADLFLGRASLPSGGAPILVDQADGSAARDAFYTKVANKSAAQVKSHWAKLVFTGKGQPPKDAGDSAGVKRAVAANPAAVGYVDKSVVDSSVKIVLNLH